MLFWNKNLFINSSKASIRFLEDFESEAWRLKQGLEGFSLFQQFNSNRAWKFRRLKIQAFIILSSLPLTWSFRCSSKFPRSGRWFLAPAQAWSHWQWQARPADCVVPYSPGNDVILFSLYLGVQQNRLKQNEGVFCLCFYSCRAWNIYIYIWKKIGEKIRNVISMLDF